MVDNRRKRLTFEDEDTGFEADEDLSARRASDAVMAGVGRDEADGGTALRLGGI